jgi:GWxTD domain-containing protein
MVFAGCSFHPERQQEVEEGDFLEPAAVEEHREVWQEISDLKSQVEGDFQNAELHRQLAVLYRLAGTPRARLLSSEEIERALSLDPQNPIYHVEKGLTLIARRFVGEAQESFVRATQIDPRCFEAWFQLGRLEQYEYFKTMCFPEHCAKAIEYFEKAFGFNRKHEETMINLGFLHAFRHMYGTGLKFATRATSYYPKSSMAHLLSGMLYTKHNEFDKAAREFAAAFLLMSDEERKPYESIAPLLPLDERELYLSSSAEKKTDWNRRYWAENDPTPSTEVNERELEHFSRVLIADWAISDERLNARGSDTDRGGTVIRYGLPDRKLYDMGSGTSGGWVVWEYDVAGGSFRLYYNDEFLNGDYHFPITDYYGETSLRVLNTIPQKYEYPIRYVFVPINVEMAELRGNDERTKLEFAVAIPDSLKRTASDSWNLFVTFFDGQWNRFSRDRVSFRPDSLSAITKPNGRFLVLTFGIEMLPRELDCTCVIELVIDQLKGKGTRKYPMLVRDMYGRSLKMSSIKLTIPDADGSCSNVLDPVPAYREHGSLCLTYEVYNLRFDESNQSHYRLTYAIRNPVSDADDSRASIQKTLSFMWASVKGKKSSEKPYIESSIEQRAQTNTVSDHLQIDIGALEKGTYLLILQVEDLVTGLAVDENRLFTVTD